jgi:hypothetical protein
MAGGDLPFGLAPSGALTAYTPTLRERATDWVRTKLFSDDREGQQRAGRVMDVAGVTPFGFGVDAYDIGREVLPSLQRGEYKDAGTALAMALFPGAKIKGFHASPSVFDEIRPSNFRGASFFASTPERATRGAGAGMNEMVMETSTVLPDAPLNVYSADIDPFKVKGLAMTPKELEWFDTLPPRIVGDDALSRAVDGGMPYGMYWDDLYDAKQIGDDLFEYVKKSAPPTLSFDEAIATDRDIYHRQWPHYGLGADEKKAARNTIDEGMGGYLVRDEGGLSIAVADPSIISDFKRQPSGGR